MDKNVRIIREHYDANVEAEWNRIAGRPEFLLTCRMLERCIKPGESVLDIGGGPGRYSIHLAQMGCDVTLLDLSGGNTMFAAARAEEIGLSLRTVTGDARDAGKLAGGEYDHVLLMGPLYHLLDEADRVRAVESAMSVLKPGGLIYVSFINMFAGIVYGMKYRPEIILSTVPDEIEYMKNVTARKSYSGNAFTKAHFTEQRDILPFMGQFPLEKLHLFGQEGVISPCEDKIMGHSQETTDAWLDFSEKVWEQGDLLSWAEHIMYVGRSLASPLPDIRDEITRFVGSPYSFNGFVDIPPLSDGEVFLICTAKNHANAVMRYVPSYRFAICAGHEKVGDIDLRIGYTDSLYYGGHIGYGVDEAHRGKGYAGKACRLIMSIAKAHGMKKILITNDVNNHASRRVCEKLGARFVREVALPEWTEMYKEGRRANNLFEVEIEV